MAYRNINVTEGYRPSHDTIQSTILIKLENGKEVFTIFDHNSNHPYNISNSELITKLRDLADHIEKEHA